MNNCFSIYHTSWITSGPKTKFICDNILAKAILFFCSCSAVNSTWLISPKLVNQSTRKVLFTCAVYTNYQSNLHVVILDYDLLKGSGKFHKAVTSSRTMTTILYGNFEIYFLRCYCKIVLCLAKYYSPLSSCRKTKWLCQYIKILKYLRSLSVRSCHFDSISAFDQFISE